MSKETGSRINFVVIALVMIGFLCNTSAWSAKPKILGEAEVKSEKRDKFRDADRDGYSSYRDCNDNDASVYPGACSAQIATGRPLRWICGENWATNLNQPKPRFVPSATAARKIKASSNCTTSMSPIRNWNAAAVTRSPDRKGDSENPVVRTIDFSG